MTAHRLDCQEKRAGMTSVAVLIGLMVIALICAGLLKVAMARRAEIGMEERKIQALWLAESGLDLGTTKLRTSADYNGETWVLTSEDLAGRGSAIVKIEVEKVEGSAESHKIRVQADFPSGSDLRSRATKEIIVKLTPLSR
jgi:type II secretory pathway component PulK